MRALVISDTHFGAWTGRDLLRAPEYRERLEPHLAGLDEVVFLGDLYDLLFGHLADSFRASEGLLALVREHIQGGRFVFLAGNHDHQIEARRREELTELELATGEPREALAPEARRRNPFRSFLERHLEGAEVDIRYPAYTFGDVLLTHGHYLDPHARLAGPIGSRLLTTVLWRIAAGGPDDPRTLEDYESVTTLLTEVLFTIAQLPHGTAAQRNVYGTAQRVGRTANRLTAPIERARRKLSGNGEQRASSASRAPSVLGFHRARKAEHERQRAAGAPALAQGVDYSVARVLSPSDPREHALEAFSKVVANLGWGERTDKIVFAHTHQPLGDVHAPGDPRIRYWNTGSWIYEPDLSSPEAYAGYLERGWPGTAVLIDTEAPAPRLIETLADLNPLHGGPGIGPGRLG
jgi:UDP-2,3-diacylglucosamine pyrophosphatase LpxH